MTGVDGKRKHVFQDNDDVAAHKPGPDTGALLHAVVTLLQDAIVRFEETADRVSGIVMTRDGGPERDLVVAMQEFDRLQQELEALGGVLERYAEATKDPTLESEGHARHGHAAIAAIAIADLRERFINHLRGHENTQVVLPLVDEEIF